MEIYIDLKKLEFVLVVSRELNVGKAAALLKFSQSYVSRGIKEFEEQQRVTFFERNGRRIVSVTSEGRAYIESIEPAFHVFQAQSVRASESAKMTSRKNAGAFLLGYSPLAPAAIPNEIRAIRSARFPALRLQIRQLTPSEMFDSIASG